MYRVELKALDDFYFPIAFNWLFLMYRVELKVEEKDSCGDD